MTVQTEVYRTPEDLAADLAELSAVDWNQVWRGLMGADPGQWCAQFGWRLELIDPVDDLLARLKSGGAIDVIQNRTGAFPRPVKWIGLSLWGANAESAADNEALFATAGSVWLRYLAAARQVLGEPTVITAWDDPKFPLVSRWPDHEQRLQLRSPYRVAGWSLPAAIVELTVSPSASAASDSQRGQMHMSLAVRPSS